MECHSIRLWFVLCDEQNLCQTVGIKRIVICDKKQINRTKGTGEVKKKRNGNSTTVTGTHCAHIERNVNAAIQQDMFALPNSTESNCIIWCAIEMMWSWCYQNIYIIIIIVGIRFGLVLARSECATTNVRICAVVRMIFGYSVTNK